MFIYSYTTCNRFCSIPSAVWFHAVENPNGFNQVMYYLVSYRETGKWPTSYPNKINQDELLNKANNQNLLESQEKFEVSKRSSSSYISDDNNNSFIDYISHFFDKFLPYNLYQYILDFFRPVLVKGYLDDLIGQQMFISILLFIVVLSLVILFTLYLFIQVLLHNKEFILKRFNNNNKLIRFYIKYQLFLVKITSIVFPILIMFGLIELLVGTYYIITHPIPYDKLPIDLHIFIKN
jgi:hypothetical protein